MPWSGVGKGGRWKPSRFMSVLSEFNLIRNRDRSAAPHQLPRNTPDTPESPQYSPGPVFQPCPSPLNSITVNTPLLDSVYPLPHTWVWVLLWACRAVLSTTHGEAAGPVSEAVLWKTVCSGTFCPSP